MSRAFENDEVEENGLTRMMVALGWMKGWLVVTEQEGAKRNEDR